MKLKLSGILFAVATLIVSQAVARPVSRTEARTAAQAFAARGKVLGVRLGTRVEKVDSLTTTDGAAYYAVKMSGGGTVITAGDDELSPIVAILPGEEDLTTLDKASPLWALLNRDLSARASAVKAGYRSAKSRAAWSRLLSAGSRPMFKAVAYAVAPVGDASGIDDVRVAPLMDVHWNQSGHGENAFTPNNYVCGCVATAMSQIMRYHCWPTDEVAPFEGHCEVDGVAKVCKAMGGLYAWDQMPGTLTSGMTTEQKEAIGKLTYDCGVAVEMSWTKEGSGAVTADVADALKTVFGYAGAKVVVNYDGLPMKDEWLGTYVYSCLDAGAPVQLGISEQTELGRRGGHSIVGDGYGFVDEISYVHLNMGWGGLGDAWYHLPDINGYQATQGGTTYNANTVETIIYNIFPEVDGYVLAGRAIDEEGLPQADAAITILHNGKEAATVTTSETGVWAAILPTGKYAITAVSSDGELKADLEVSMGNNNSWGNEMTLTAPAVRIGEETYSSLNYALRQATTGDVVEVFGPTSLKKSVDLGFDCTVCASGDAVSNVVRVSNNAKITLQTGARLALTNLCFVGQTDTPLISVETSATLSIAGLIDLGTVELMDATGLDLAGDISKSIYVKTTSNKTGDAFATYSCAQDVASACANYLLNTANDELGGTATEDGTLVWGTGAPVPDDVAVARLEVDGTPRNFRSFSALMRNLPEEGDVGIQVIKDVSLELDEALELTNRKVTIVGNGMSAPTMTIAQGSKLKDNKIVCLPGSELVLENVTVKGSTKSESGQQELFRVDGGALTLGAGAVIEDHITTDPCPYGAIALLSGEVTLKDGARIANCSAQGSKAQGGAIYVADGTLHLENAVITNCTATSIGQGVYVNGLGDAKVELAEKVAVDGYLYVFARDMESTPLEVVSPLAPGSMILIDNRFKTTSKDALSEGQLIATVADGVSFNDAETEATRRAFINTKHEELGAEFSGQTLVWGEKLPDPPEPGLVRVIQGATTNEYQTIEEAFASITEDATVEILSAFHFFSENLTVTNNVTLTTDPDAGGMAWLFRGFGMIRVCGGSLTLTNILIDGYGYEIVDDEDDGPTIYAERGGSVTLGKDAIMFDQGGFARNDASAILLNASTFTMLDGARITECWNEWVDEVKGDSGCGAAVYAYNGSTVNLLGGKIDNCVVAYGAVFLQQGSKGFIGGDFTVAGNEMGYFEGEGEDAEWISLYRTDLLLDEYSTLEIVSELTGSIGRDYVASKRSDANYVAQVSDWRDWEFSALTNSVTAFFHDTNTVARAALVTNETATALVVWSTALQDGVFTAKDGTVYGLLGEKPEPGPDPDPEMATPNPIAFTKIVMNADNTEVTLAFTNAVQWCNYAIFGAPSLQAGFGAVPVTNFQWQVTEPKVEITLPTNGNLFWKAMAAEGLIKE